MAFYNSIANNYDSIFPFNESQFTFISQNRNQQGTQSILEIGSATGSLAAACDKIGYSVEGLELDETMVKLARKKYPNIVFRQGNMLNLDRLYSSSEFETIVCFGNTIVHLQDLSEIIAFLSHVYNVLSERGRFLLQFINYDRILDFKETSLPRIENEHITFERNYKIKSELSIDFNTHLWVRATQEHIYNTQALYPLRKQAFETIAHSLGFKTRVYGNFAQTPWSIDAMQSIFICEK